MDSDGHPEPAQSKQATPGATSGPRLLNGSSGHTHAKYVCMCMYMYITLAIIIYM